MSGSATGSGGLEVRRGSTSQDVTPFNFKFTWTDSLLRGGWTWDWVFDTEDWYDWRKLLVGSDRNPGRQFRLTSQEGVNESATPWRDAYVDSSSMAINGRTLSVRVRGGDIRLEMQQLARTRAFPARSAHEVVEQIASEYDLTPDVEKTIGSRDRWQLRQDDWSYMCGLAAESASQSQRGDMYLWVEGDVLHYRAPSLGAPSVRRHDLSEVEVRVNKTVVNYHGRAVDRRGGASLLGVGYDVLGGQALSFNMNGAAASTHPALATQLTRPPADGLRVIPVYSQVSDLVEGSTRSFWGESAPRYFTLRVETRPDLTLRAGSIIEMQANLNERQSAPVFGRYLVLEVQHVLDGSDLRTTAVCFRREAFRGEDAPTGAAVSQGGTLDKTRGASQRPRIVLVAEVLP